MKKVVLVKERDSIRLLEGTGSVSKGILELRSRLTGGDLTYYELNYNQELPMQLDAYIVALNQHPEILDKSAMITKI